MLEMQRVSRIRRSVRKLHGDVVTVTYLSYLGDRINSGGGCEAAGTSGTGIGWAKFRDCLDLLCGVNVLVKIKVNVYKNYLRSTMLCGSEAWYLGHNEIGILQ